MSPPGDPLLVRSPPVTYAKATAQPILIVHAEVGDAVPPSQLQSLPARLQGTGELATLVMVANAKHNFAPTAGAITTTRRWITRLVADIFDESLGR